MLAQIRSRLEEEHGRGIHLYDDAIRKQWDPRARPSPNPNLWDDFVRRAREFSNRRNLDSYEVDYKLEIGRKLAEAREAVLDGVDDWGRLVNTGMTSSINNLIHYIQISKFHGWMNESSDDALIGELSICVLKARLLRQGAVLPLVLFLKPPDLFRRCPQHHLRN